MIVIATKSRNIGKRYLSNILDYLFFFILLYGMLVVIGHPNGAGGYTVTGMKAFTLPLLWLLYFPVLESIFEQTPAKMMLGLYVVDLKGEQPSIVETFLRRLLDPIDLVFLGIPSILAINHSARGQRLGDMFADTLVIAKDAACRHCGAELELNPKEVVNKSFQCPKCAQVN